MLHSLAQLWHQYPEPWRILIPTFLWVNTLTALAFLVAKKAKLLPSVRQRDVHSASKPRIGGLAMWLTVMIMFLLIATNPSTLGLLQFGQRTILGMDASLWGIMVGMLIILFFGLWDDIMSLSPYVQLIGQFLAALALIIFGVGVQYIRLPSGSLLYLDKYAFHLPMFMGGGEIWVLSSIFTLVWVVVMINVMNFFDGLDGLSGSIATTAAVALFFVSMRVGFVGTATLSLILAAAAGGFLIWNWYPSKIFMGTIGSQLLGFLLAVIAIISGGKVATAVLVLGLPILDALVVIIRRLAAGQSPFKADQRHLHHRLLKIGLPVPWVVILLNAVGVTFGILAIQTQESSMKGLLSLALVICMVVFIFITYLLERRVKGRVI